MNTQLQKWIPVFTAILRDRSTSEQLALFTQVFEKYADFLFWLAGQSIKGTSFSTELESFRKHLLSPDSQIASDFAESIQQVEQTLNSYITLQIIPTGKSLFDLNHLNFKVIQEEKTSIIIRERGRKIADSFTTLIQFGTIMLRNIEAEESSAQINQPHASVEVTHAAKQSTSKKKQKKKKGNKIISKKTRREKENLVQLSQFDKLKGKIFPTFDHAPNTHDYSHVYLWGKQLHQELDKSILFCEFVLDVNILISDLITTLESISLIEPDTGIDFSPVLPIDLFVYNQENDPECNTPISLDPKRTFASNIPPKYYCGTAIDVFIKSNK